MTSTLMRHRAEREVTVQPSAVVAADAVPLIRLVGLEKVYRTGKLEYPALRGRSGDRRRRDGRDRRPVGQRQVDDHEHDHRHRPADRGRR